MPTAEKAPNPGTVVQALDGDCDAGGCGSSNSPEINHRGVHDFDTTFANANAEGFRLLRFVKNHVEYKPVVYQATLTGRHPRTGAIMLSGGGQSPTSLVGARFVVAHEDLGTEYVIQIDDVGSAPYWARPNNTQLTTPTYLVNWTVSQNGEPQGTWKNICRSPPSDDTDTLGMNRFHVVLFETDRIDAVGKRFYDLDTRWVNIGCAQHALSKQHLDGHTQGAMNASPLFTTTRPERTAHLKMLAADYCGDGDPITVVGQLLNWKDERGWLTYATHDPDPALEARWDENGATCLNTPRLLANHTAVGDELFPDVWGAIKDACDAAGKEVPKQCQAPLDQPLGAHILSANPIPP